MNKNYTLKTISSVFAITLMAFLALGSNKRQAIENTDLTRVEIPRGTLENSNIRIVAEDGSFVLEGGQEFSTPFVSDLWDSYLPTERLTENYDAALAAGAKPVKVYVGGRNTPLYGVLAFNNAVNASVGPGSRSYLVSIPADKISGAYSGNTTVSYEKVTYKRTWSNGGRQNAWSFGWVLWLSATRL